MFCFIVPLLYVQSIEINNFTHEISKDGLNQRSLCSSVQEILRM